MGTSYQKNTPAHLRRSAALAIGRVLRNEYETVMPGDIPPKLRDLIARFDEPRRQSEATAARERE